MNIPVFFNIAIRVGMLLSRTLFIFFAAKFLTLEELGLYSLFGITIAFSLYLLGFDFYSFTTRELIGAPIEKQTVVIFTQLKFNFISYSVFFGPLLLLFFFGRLPWTLFSLFFLLLLTECISQELTRILIALESQLKASIILFSRTAIWGYILIPLFYFLPSTRSTEWVITTWFISSFFSVVVALYYLKHIKWFSFFSHSLSLGFIIKGVKIAVPMFIGTMIIRAVFTIDRYYIEVTDGLALLGIYSVFIGICNALISFVDAAVFQFNYPRLIKFANAKDYHNFKYTFFKLIKSTLVCISFLLVCLYLSIDWVLELLSKKEYKMNINLMWCLVMSHILLILSNIPHYVLFAFKKDKWILAGNVAAITIFLLSLYIINFEQGIYRVAIALIISMLTLLLVKLVGVLYFKRDFGLFHRLNL